jgi:hypothetical protein
LARPITSFSDTATTNSTAAFVIHPPQKKCRRIYTPAGTI